MTYTPDFYLNKETIIKFYLQIRGANFQSITRERRKELDGICNYYQYLTTKTPGGLFKATFIAEQINVHATNFGLNNKDEKAYFYIKMIDPDLLFLEIFEAANMVEDIKRMAFLNLNYYDGFLIHLERKYNKYFKDYTASDLWARERIKRD